MGEPQPDPVRALREVRQAVREREVPARPTDTVLPAPRTPLTPDTPPDISIPATPPTLSPPDNAPVNAAWNIGSVPLPGGWRGRLVRLLRRLLAPLIDAQVAFNSRQVQLDNELLAYLDARFDRTHRHYDAILGVHGRHIADINERHVILQEELVAHVHDLVQRIDLVMSELERTRVSLETTLRDLERRTGERR